MDNRTQYIESILEGIYAIKRKFMANDFSGAKFGKDSFKNNITASQWAVLAIVMKNGNIGVKELVKELGITSSAITQLVDELAKKGYLVRASNIQDRRVISLKLSDRRKKQMAAIKAAKVKRLKTVFQNLTDRELSQYANLSKKIADGALSLNKSTQYIK